MNKEENKINFDISTLSLDELIKVYEDICDFLEFLEQKKVEQADKAEPKND